MMKILITALGSYLTGDEIADAVLEYAQALADERATDVVDIPISGDGGSMRLRMSVGWLVQVHAMDAETEGSELTDPATSTRLRERATRLTVHRMSPEPFEPLGLSDYDWLRYA